MVIITPFVAKMSLRAVDNLKSIKTYTMFTFALHSMCTLDKMKELSVGHSFAQTSA